ncbi:MAG: ABC transporter substrate-binding protein [Candidatus Rokubacteria bacterium]|nr:ABC transporter substrate-binding protein [Candidatus Rokubacteria bacterium]
MEPRCSRREFLALAGSSSAVGLLGARVRSAAASQAAKPRLSGTVKFWHQWGEARLPIMEAQMRAFEAVHPGVKVESNVLGFAGVQEKHMTAIAGGDPPDVIMLRRSELPAYAARTALMSLDDFVKRDGLNVDEIFYAAEVQSARFRGRLYAIPNVSSGAVYLLFYNKDHFRESGLEPDRTPATWEELEEAARKTTRKEGGQLVRVGCNVGIANYTDGIAFANWLYNNNGRLFDDKAERVAFNEKEGVETLRWMVDFTDRLYGGWDKIVAVTGRDRTTNRVAWTSEKAAMVNDGDWLFFMIKTQYTNILGRYGVGLVPYNAKNPHAKSQNYTEGGWAWAIPRGSKNPEAAWEWVKHIGAGEGAYHFFKPQERPLPVRKFNEDPDFLKLNPFMPVVRQALSRAVALPSTPAFPKVRDILRTMTEEALARKKTPEEAIKSAAIAAQRELDRWR